MPRFLTARKRSLPTTVLSALLASAAVEATGPTGALNDTGQTQCLNAAGTALEACSAANSGDASPYPRQDGRFGRDSAAGKPGISGFSKPAGSGGSGGFAFTPLDVNGNAIALTGNPPVPSETPRCVWDRVTNLIWEVKTDDGGLQDKDWTYGWGSYSGGDCKLGGSNCDTENYVLALNSANVCPVNGSDVWRLPNRRELLSIVDHNHFTPAIDYNYFPNTPSGFFWSSDVYAHLTEVAWDVNFNNGDPDALSKATNSYIRLVRNGPGSGSVLSNFVVNNDGTVTDTTTGLIWDQCPWGLSGPACLSGTANTSTWLQALGLAVNANLGKGYKNHNDWRLPNRTELESLVKISAYSPSIDTTIFPNTQGDYFWTSTVYKPDTNSAWFVTFFNGDTSVTSPT